MVFLFEINMLRVFVFVCSCGEERKNNMLQVILFFLILIHCASFIVKSARINSFSHRVLFHFSPDYILI